MRGTKSHIYTHHYTQRHTPCAHQPESITKDRRTFQSVHKLVSGPLALPCLHIDRARGRGRGQQLVKGLTGVLCWIAFQHESPDPVEQLMTHFTSHQRGYRRGQPGQEELMRVGR